MEHVSSVRPTGKFPEKVENLKRWSRFPGWNFRTESRVPFTFLVVCTSSRSTVGKRHVPGFSTKWKFHFCYHRNFRVFFLNGKRPLFSSNKQDSVWQELPPAGRKNARMGTVPRPGNSTGHKPYYAETLYIVIKYF